MKWLSLLASLAVFSAATAGEYVLGWDPVTDDRLTGYEAQVAERDQPYAAGSDWAGAEEQTAPFDLQEDQWYKARVRAVGEEGGSTIYSLWSTELQWFATSPETVIMMPSVTTIHVGRP